MSKSNIDTPAQNTAQAGVKFNRSPEDDRLIERCVSRAVTICQGLKLPVPQKYRMELSMDLAATHANGNPMDFARLLGFDDFNFMHDISGITKHLDRSTGKLCNHFSPRASSRDEGKVTND